MFASRAGVAVCWLWVLRVSNRWCLIYCRRYGCYSQCYLLPYPSSSLLSSSSPRYVCMYVYVCVCINSVHQYVCILIYIAHLSNTSRLDCRARRSSSHRGCIDPTPRWPAGALHTANGRTRGAEAAPPRAWARLRARAPSGRQLRNRIE